MHSQEDKIMQGPKQKFWPKLLIKIILTAGILFHTNHVVQAIELSKGQLVYIPVYSHIYWGDLEKNFS